MFVYGESLRRSHWRKSVRRRGLVRPHRLPGSVALGIAPQGCSGVSDGATSVGRWLTPPGGGAPHLSVVGYRQHLLHTVHSFLSLLPRRLTHSLSLAEDPRDQSAHSACLCGGTAPQRQLHGRPSYARQTVAGLPALPRLAVLTTHRTLPGGRARLCSSGPRSA